MPPLQESNDAHNILPYPTSNKLHLFEGFLITTNIHRMFWMAFVALVSARSKLGFLL